MQKVYVVDSSVLLHDPNAIYEFEDNEIVIPFVVLEELERKKRAADNVGMAAREIIRQLDGLRQAGPLAGGVRLKSGGVLRIELNHSSPEVLPLFYDPSLADNRILTVSLNLTREEKRPVILVTKDIAMRVKADAVGIKTQDYYNDKVALPPIGDEIITVPLGDGDVDSLYHLGKIFAPVPLPPNACVKGILADQSILPLMGSSNGHGLHYHSLGKLSTWDIIPKNIEQSWAMYLLNNPSVSLVNLIGPAGTGKTLLALASGLQQTLHSEIYSRLLCARPIVPFGKDIGFLPGEKEDKVRPYMQPIYDNLELLLRPKKDKSEKNSDSMVDSAIDLLKKKHQLEIEILTYIRGRSIPNQFMIIDEAQNLSVHEIKTIITRAGEGTKIVLCGDPDQIDHPYLDKESNGIAHLTHRLKGKPFYGQVRLTKGERSELASFAAELL
ncbi:PhoH family protein [Desulfitobacterium sp.]|uniref:PhoH family protein n=1 Tax=Desulfitobacterium sp. TaxID=49981 RepID=UPI002B1F477D|nr:PhoH family protein [Desulfitobacterium sp.]MEA4902092.1 PhoH family protein [Desulfitobacterium sp.]